MASSKLENELLQFKNSKYVVPNIKGYTPFGGCVMKKGDCDACEMQNIVLTNWVTHIVYEDNATTWTKKSHYCENCYNEIDPIVQELWVNSKKTSHCVIL